MSSFSLIRKQSRLVPLASCVLCLGLLVSQAGAAPAGLFGELSGRALDEVGGFLAGVEILTARIGDPGREPLQVKTDRLGRFLFRRLPQGEYWIVATKSGRLAAFTKVAQLPAAGLDLVLPVGVTDGQAEMEWVLRLPARDLLQALDQGFSAPTAGKSASSSESFRALFQQSFGLSVAGGQQDAADQGRGPVLGTLLNLSGGAGPGVAWNSAADFRGVELGEKGSGATRSSQNLGLSGGSEIRLGEVGYLSAQARFRHQSLTLTDQEEETPATRRATGVDMEALLGEGQATGLAIHFRDLSSAVETGAASQWEQQVVGASLSHAFQWGGAHELTASLLLREFSATADGLVLADGGASRAGEHYWLVPDGSWILLSLRDRLAPTPNLVLHYGADLAQNQQNGSSLAPAMEMSWTPLARTHLSAGVRYLAENEPQQDGDRRDLSPLSLQMALTQEFSTRTRLVVAWKQENLGIQDPLSSEDWQGGESFHGVWTDGQAQSRQVQVALDQTLGPVLGRLQYRSGDTEGRIATPDPFEFAAVALEDGRAHFTGLRAAAVVGSSGTEVSLAFDHVYSEAATDYRVVGLSISQGFSIPFDAPGDWRLLLDYEGIDGGRPFLQSAKPVRVERVSGGVSVRF